MSNLIIQIDGVKLTIPVRALRQIVAAKKLPAMRPIPYTGPTNVLFEKLDRYEFSVRLANCLLNEGIEYVGEVIQKTEADLLAISNFGRKSLNELKEMLATKKLTLGMIVPAWTNDTIARYKKQGVAA
jgi:DNA-directed RNA polymerase subunit alpha